MSARLLTRQGRVTMNSHFQRMQIESTPGIDLKAIFCDGSHSYDLRQMVSIDWGSVTRLELGRDSK